MAIKTRKHENLTETNIQRVWLSFGNICNKNCNICRPARSSIIAKEYKKLGGKYSNNNTKSKKNSDLDRWYKEKWVDLNRPIKNPNGKVIGYKPCGRKSLPLYKGILKSPGKNQKWWRRTSP